MCFARMPLRPAGRLQRRGDARINKDDGGKRSPRTAKENALRTGLGSNAAVIEDVPAFLPGIATALGRKVDRLTRQRVDLAIAEVCLRIAEDEINVALNVAIGEIL